MMSEPTVTKEDFIERYAARSGVSWGVLAQYGLKALPCNQETCSDDTCPGWQVARVQKWGWRWTHEFVEDVAPAVLSICFEQQIIDMIKASPWIDRKTIEWEVHRPEYATMRENADYIVIAHLWESRTLPHDRWLRIG